MHVLTRRGKTERCLFVGRCRDVKIHVAERRMFATCAPVGGSGCK